LIDDYEIVIVDNDSADGTPARVEALVPHARIVQNTANIGHSRAVNEGIRAACGRYLLVLDADTEVEDDALGTLLQFLEQHEDVGIAAPRTFNTDGSVQKTARAFPRPLNGLFGRQSLLTRWFPRNRFSCRYLQNDDLKTMTPFDVQQVSGACMMFPRALVSEVGSWDEGYFAYWVDTDWCFRVGRHGRRIVCVPAARVIHHEQNRPGKPRSLHRIWHFHYGAYRFYRNNMTLGRLDPRALFALLALGLHALWQIVQNASAPAEVKGADGPDVPVER
jgi:GT2 family glycosyltransferase